MNDRQILDSIIGIGTRNPISGPWRLTVWDSPTSGKIYVFSEEHANPKSCPESRHFSALAAEILQKTKGVHILVENFIHASEIVVPKSGRNATMQQACSPVNVGILNNLRNCLEVMKINSRHCPGGCAKRIHFVDPRVDMVSVLPDGKLFEAISHYTMHLASKGSFVDAVLTVFESLIHPLSGLLPDRRNLSGRLVGAFDIFRNGMSSSQRRAFDSIWHRDITGGITDINKKYVDLHAKYSSSMTNKNNTLADFSDDVEDIKESYKRYTNKFMDVWLLAHIFMVQNTSGSNGMVLYLGSLHGLQTEKYLASTGLRKINHLESHGLASCLSVT